MRRLLYMQEFPGGKPNELPPWHKNHWTRLEIEKVVRVSAIWNE